VTYPLTKLKDEYDITVFFYNPNIHPEEEYVKRRDEAIQYTENLNIPFIEGPYDTYHWLKETSSHKDAPEGGPRCALCFAMRLEAAAIYAQQHSFDAFTTTLTVSPHKNYDTITNIGNSLAQKYSTTYLPENFKKNDGYRKSIALSKQANLYRQNYCGCLVKGTRP